MSVGGICQVCEANPAEHQCDRCGTLVCRTHYDQEAGCCVDCARQGGRGLQG